MTVDRVTYDCSLSRLLDDYDLPQPNIYPNFPPKRPSYQVMGGNPYSQQFSLQDNLLQGPTREVNYYPAQAQNISFPQPQPSLRSFVAPPRYISDAKPVYGNQQQFPHKTAYSTSGQNSQIDYGFTERFMNMNLTGSSGYMNQAPHSTNIVRGRNPYPYHRSPNPGMNQFSNNNPQSYPFSNNIKEGETSGNPYYGPASSTFQPNNLSSHMY